GRLNGTYDVILLCCKAYDFVAAIDGFAPAMGDQSAIVPLLNGVRHIDVLTERFGRQRVLGGLRIAAWGAIAIRSRLWQGRGVADEALRIVQSPATRSRLPHRTPWMSRCRMPAC